MYDFIRVGAAVPKLKVADCIYNSREIIKLINEANEKEIKILAFPELCLTSYTCGDLFMQSALLISCEKALSIILQETKHIDIFITLGIPVTIDNQCFNCAIAIHMGKIIGVVPKTFLPNYSEFYEKRWFSSANDLISSEITILSQIVPIGADLIFEPKSMPKLKIGIEICEDLWSPIPPSSYLSIYGANIILNLSASNEIASKSEYRRALVSRQSASCISAYVYSSAGIGESTQDLVFSGHSMICENGNMLNETPRFSKNNELIYSDIDIEILCNDRKRNSGFMTHLNNSDQKRLYRKVEFEMKNIQINSFERYINPSPFVPSDKENLNLRCKDIFDIQIAGLSKRILHTECKSLVIGISGGLDSTLALLASVKAFDFLELDRKNIIGVTMPGFGTTDRTYTNAISLMESLNITLREISIKQASLQHFKDIDHDPSVHDVAYENTQARERTQILMDIANKEAGLVIGTGDLSELALGWATYNGDHMSNYGINSGVPKTLVRALVKWVADFGSLDKKSCDILTDILDTPVSPELLPPDIEGNINQKTEEIVGPYELHDFFLYYVVRFGFSPSKIYFLAEHSFKGIYDKSVIIIWLKNFYKRFFSQQFKRSCMPDGPKVGSISLSPRGDWRMPSDACSRIWLDELNNLE